MTAFIDPDALCRIATEVLWHATGWSESERERFWKKVDKTDACWLWTGSVKREYGVVRRRYRQWSAHRVAYELVVGRIPDGLVVDHLCRVTRCVNPAHLEAVTPAENSVRSNTGGVPRGECRHGHELTAANSRIDKRGRRECRACKQARNAVRDRRGAAAPENQALRASTNTKTKARPARRAPSNTSGHGRTMPAGHAGTTGV